MAEEVEALAVYDRPIASLTFSDSVRAEWQGTSGIVNQAAPLARNTPSIPNPIARKLTPRPTVAARLPQPTRSGFPNTLAPITAEAAPSPDARPPSNWGDLSVVLASDLRAAKASSRRVALWAALGSAAVASALTLWLVRAPAPRTAEAPSLVAVPRVASQPIQALEATAPLEAPTAPLAAKSQPPPKRVVPKPAARRPRAEPLNDPTLTAASEAPSSDNPYGGSEASEPNKAGRVPAVSNDEPLSASPPLVGATPEAAPTSADQAGF